MGKHKPRYTPTREEIIDQLEVLSAEPFVQILADFVEARPSVEAIKAFAEKSPDRWSQGLTISGRLAGYKSDAQITVNNLLVNLSSMSDAEVQLALEQRLKPYIDGKAVEIEGEAKEIAEQAGATEQNKAAKD